METSLDSSSTPGLRSTSRSAVTSTLRAWKPSPDTAATARVARCRRSRWSTSATEQFSLRRSATSPLTTERLSFSEVASGRRRSRRSRAINMGPVCSRSFRWGDPGAVPRSIRGGERAPPRTPPKSACATGTVCSCRHRAARGRPRLSEPPAAAGRRTSTRDLYHLVGLDLVTFLDVLEVLQTDAALEAGRDGAHVLLEAAQGVDPPVVHDHAVAHQSGPGPAVDIAGGDVGARHHADPRHPEGLPHLGGAELPLLELGRQHALERLVDVLDELVDDRVETDVHAFAVGQLARGRRGPHREADHDRAGGRRQADVALVDRAGALVEDAQADLGDVQLAQGVVDRLDRAHHVGLDHQRQLLELALLDPGEEVLEARGGAGGDLGLALARLARLGDRAGDPLVGDRADLVAGHRHGRQAEHLDRLRRQGRGDLLAVLVVHVADASEGRTGHDRVADVQRAAADQDGRDRAAPLVEVRLDDGALRAPVGVGPQVQLHVGHQQDGLDQIVEAQLALCRHVHELGLAAVLLGHQVILGELLAHPDGVGLRLVDLVDRHHDRHPGRLGVVDRLDGLRHVIVVSGDQQHHHVGDGGTARTHGGERLVARGVDEGHQAAVGSGLDLVGADVLGDAAGLGGDHVGTPDGVQQLGLAVVDVTHHRHHRRARPQVLVTIGLVVLPALDGDELVGLGGVDDLDAGADLLAQQRDRIVRHRLGRGQHLAHLHEDADEVGRWPAETVGEVLHGHPAGDADDAVDRDVGPRLDARGVHRLEFLAPPGSAPAPLGTRTAETGEAPATAAARTAAATTGAATAATEPRPAATTRTAGTPTGPAGAATRTAATTRTAGTPTGTAGTATRTAAAEAATRTAAGTAGTALTRALTGTAATTTGLTGTAATTAGLAGTAATTAGLAGTASAGARARTRRQGTATGRHRAPNLAGGPTARRQRPHPRRERATLARLTGLAGTWLAGPHARRQRPHPGWERATALPGRAGLAGTWLSGPHLARLTGTRLTGLAGTWLSGPHLARLSRARLARLAASRSNLAGLNGPGLPRLTGTLEPRPAGAGLPRLATLAGASVRLAAGTIGRSAATGGTTGPGSGPLTCAATAER